jgi:hypothetical protein
MAADIDSGKIVNALQESCGQLKTDIGLIDIKYKVLIRSDYCEIQAHLDYGLLNDIQYGEYKYKDKLKATEQIKVFTQDIYKTASTLYPGLKFIGFYSAEFESIRGYTKSIMYFNWQGDNNQFTWQTEKDSSWNLSKCEWLEK